MSQESCPGATFVGRSARARNKRLNKTRAGRIVPAAKQTRRQEPGTPLDRNVLNPTRLNGRGPKAKRGSGPFFTQIVGSPKNMKRSLGFIAMACLAVCLPSVCFAQDHPADDKLTREELQSRVNATRERLKQRREELRLEREKPIEPKREALRFDREKRLGPKQEELRLDREKRLGPKQEELRLEIEPKRDELRRERDVQREQKGIVPSSPTQAR
jgi:hypothetical protein